MKIIISTVSLLLILASTANCDELDKYAKINFIKELGIVHIKALSLVNTGPYAISILGVNKKNASLLAKKYGLYLGYYKYGPIEVEDIVRSKKIKIKIRYEQPKGGQCGANPPAVINLWINGKQIIKNVLFHEECFGRPSINEAIIYINDEGSPRVELTVAKNDWQTLLSLFFTIGSFAGEHDIIDEKLLDEDIERTYPKLNKLYQN